MKLLKIKVDGLPQYNKPFEVSFYATQRVQSNHLNAVEKLFGNIYVNTVEAFIGINASGKTRALSIISFVGLLLSGESLNFAIVTSPLKFTSAILEENKKTVFDIDFFVENNIYHLTSEIIKKRERNQKYSIHIEREKLWRKQITKSINKNNIFNFSDKKPILVRDNSEEFEYLSDDVSIMIGLNKQFKKKTLFEDTESFYTNLNLISFDEENISKEILTFLDPTIESLIIKNNNNKHIIKLKFYGIHSIELDNVGKLSQYLSSGTVKGIRVFIKTIEVLQNGGYLIVDEIENHFNREIVAALLRMFMNKRTNPNGAVIVFSTHYPDLLDEIGRNDAVFITKNTEGLAVYNLASLLTRNDMKKSEVYQSNFLGGTAPRYKSLMTLQNSIIRSLEEIK